VLGYIKKYEEMDITMHHIFSVMLCGYVLFTGRNGYMLLDLTFWGEITNPVLSLAEILEFRGAKKKFIIPLQLIFLVSFITVRCTIASWHVFEIQTSNTDFIFKLCPTFICFQSYEWTWMMLNKVGKLAFTVRTPQTNLLTPTRCSKAILSLLPTTTC
jgi:hypothetical protein